MLQQLTVKHFAIAEHIEILFQQGMTVLTGETGAGKSIILDALGLALGDRADTSMVRHGQSKAEISAVFDLATQATAEAWLKEHDLDDDAQCILRRVITAEGRSRSYINGQPCSLQNLKAIGEKLIDIHSQHEHQSLLQKDNHRGILDTYAQIEPLAEDVASAYRAWAEKAQQLAQLESNQDEMDARLQLLTFQVDELDKLSLQDGEIETLEHEQSTLANAELLLGKAHEALGICTEGEPNLTGMVNAASNALQNLPSENEHLNEALTLFNEAQIQLDEAGNSLRHFVDSFELNPERLSWVEERLSASYQLARKHRCSPSELTQIHTKLAEEMSHYLNGDQSLEQLTNEAGNLFQDYLSAANSQRKTRTNQAKELEKAISKQLTMMDMKSVVLVAQLKSLEQKKYSQHGIDTIEFLISTNPGQPAKALNKVASGGELSRVSLAIQVVIAQNSTIPTLVFDEVDVGIGGGTAQIVGRLLKGLGNKGQIICVTHLPQVASQGHHHYFISKRLEENEVRSSIDSLDSDGRTKEIARMLGGVKITDQTLAHAKEMIETA